MWIATIDFMNASDSIKHNAIWDALKTCGIEHEYISLLKRLYKNPKATDMTDKESDMFETKKGVTRWLALQHCTVGGLERRPSALAKEMLGTLRVRLPHKFEIF